MKLFQPVESTFISTCCVKFLVQIGQIVFELKFLQKLKRGRRGGPRHIWRSIVFEIYGNFEAHLLSALGKELVQIDVLRTIESNLPESTRNKKLGHCARRMQ